MVRPEEGMFALMLVFLSLNGFREKFWVGLVCVAVSGLLFSAVYYGPGVPHNLVFLIICWLIGEFAFYRAICPWLWPRGSKHPPPTLGS